MPWNPIVAGVAGTGPADPFDHFPSRDRIRSRRPTIGDRASAAAAMVSLSGPRPPPRWPGFGRRRHWQGNCGWLVERFVKRYGDLAGTVLGFIGRLLISPADRPMCDTDRASEMNSARTGPVVAGVHAPPSQPARGHPLRC